MCSVKSEVSLQCMEALVYSSFFGNCSQLEWVCDSRAKQSQQFPLDNCFVLFSCCLPFMFQVVQTLAVAIFLTTGTLLFLVFPPLVFSYVEGWSYGEGFYFTFITLSTIGFGDYVVGNKEGELDLALLKLATLV